jgi:hypothetical protein
VTPAHVRRAYGLLLAHEELIERMAECDDPGDMDTIWRALGTTIVILVDIGVDMAPHLAIDRVLDETRARARRRTHRI